MQAAIDRVIEAWGMIANLTAEEATAARAKVAEYLAGQPETDEKSLAVKGLCYLRSAREPA